MLKNEKELIHMLLYVYSKQNKQNFDLIKNLMIVKIKNKDWIKE